MADSSEILSQRYVALCYHYIRPSKERNPFPRIMGNTVAQLHEHLVALKARFQVLSLDQIRSIAAGQNVLLDGRVGLLLTFDDGLSDHYKTARILREHDVPGTFFIPTCIIADREPANPMVIHYGVAIHGVERFLHFWRQAIGSVGLDITTFDVPFRRGIDDPWQTIARIKEAAKYRLNPDQARKVLLTIWQTLLKPGIPDIMAQIHLTPEQVGEIERMGHTLGTHSHSHVSVAADRMSDAQFEREVVEPKTILQETSRKPIYAMSYPFGEARDCLSSATLLERTRDYELAFTVEPKVNTPLTSAWELGRYMPWSSEDGSQVLAKLEKIMSKGAL